MISPPRNQGQYPDRLIDCEEALEPMFLALMEEAFAHGWAPGETRRALRRLIAAHLQAGREVARLETDMALMRAMEKASKR